MKKNSLIVGLLKYANKLFILSFLLFIHHAEAQNYIQVSGRHILGPCGDTIVLKGINYAPYNWGWSTDQIRIDELAKTKANCVRLVWYKKGETGNPAALYANLDMLDSVLAKSIKNQLIPILVLHDQTCKNSAADLLSLSSWYEQDGVLRLIEKYKHSLILNIANEALYVNWSANPTEARATFQATYTTIIQKLRAQGIQVPLMIDGPDCGTNLAALALAGPSLLASDPEKNLIFSAHSYWYSYARNDSLQMANEIKNALLANIPFVFGEVANLQDDVSMCQHVLNYKPLLKICKQKKIGWLAWSWDNDGCSNRQISNNGSFASLTDYGQEMVFNATFGITNDSSAKSKFLQFGNCVVTNATQYSNRKDLKIIPNPSNGYFQIPGLEENIKPIVFSMLGKPIEIQKTGMDGDFQFAKDTNPGVYKIVMGKITQPLLLLNK